MRSSALLLVLAVGGFAIAAPSAAPTAAAMAVVYYFHATTRCATCRTIEAYAHETVVSRFAADLEARRLEWQAVNVDEPAEPGPSTVSARHSTIRSSGAVTCLTRTAPGPL